VTKDFSALARVALCVRMEPSVPLIPEISRFVHQVISSREKDKLAV
jgi:hypothetical protein